MYAIEFNNIYKKYAKGEKFYALRDRIPDLFKKLVTGQALSRQKKEEFWAVKGVDFRLKKGEVLGIIGPNGAGKSTILKLLSRITPPTKGSIKLNGKFTSLIETTAGFHPEFTGRENIYFNGAVLGMTKKEIDAKFKEIVDFSGVKEFIDTPVKRYSSGMSARLGFAVAAHINPDIMLVDEVLAVGDMTFQAKCIEKMRALFKSGVTIVLVSHNTNLVKNLCQRVLLLNKGSVIQDGPPEDVIPYYENLVSEHREQELKRRLAASKDEVKSKDGVIVHINAVQVLDSSGSPRESFGPDEPFSIRVDFKAVGRLASPIFVCEVIRSDRILCCYVNSKDQKFDAGAFDGESAVQLKIDRTSLGPGVYFVKCAIWDREQVHPYVTAQKAIFMIEAKDISHCNCVFRLPARWEK